MKKILFSILAVAAFAFTASAQDTGFGYGVKAGINIANLTNSDGNYKVGFTGGIFADYRFSNLFALSADVLYSRQGAKGDDAKIKTDNLNIPILANFYLVKGRRTARVPAGRQRRHERCLQNIRPRSSGRCVIRLQLRPDPRCPLQHRSNQGGQG